MSPYTERFIILPPFVEIKWLWQHLQTSSEVSSSILDTNLKLCPNMAQNLFIGFSNIIIILNLGTTNIVNKI